MDMLLPFIVGWFGSVWWPGIEVDAPRPGDPQPWWRGLLLGIVGGVSAIVVGRLVPGMEGMAALVVAIAAGRVGSGIVASAMGAMGR